MILKRRLNTHARATHALLITARTHERTHDCTAVDWRWKIVARIWSPQFRSKFEKTCVICRRRSAISRRCNTIPWCTAVTTEVAAWVVDRCDPGPWRRDTTRLPTAACLTSRHLRRTPGEERTRTRLCIRAPTKLASRPPLYLIDEVATHVGFFLVYFLSHTFSTCFRRAFSLDTRQTRLHLRISPNLYNRDFLSRREKYKCRLICRDLFADNFWKIRGILFGLC